MGADLAYAWFPGDERPTVDVSASRDGLDFLGALTETGETLFQECSGSFTEEITVQFLHSRGTSERDSLSNGKNRSAWNLSIPLSMSI